MTLNVNGAPQKCVVCNLCNCPDSPAGATGFTYFSPLAVAGVCYFIF